MLNLKYSKREERKGKKREPRPYNPRQDGSAHATTFWPGPSTTRPDNSRARLGVQAVLRPTSEPMGWLGPTRVLGVSSITA